MIIQRSLLGCRLYGDDGDLGWDHEPQRQHTGSYPARNEHIDIPVPYMAANVFLPVARRDDGGTDDRKADLAAVCMSREDEPELA